MKRFNSKILSDFSPLEAYNLMENKTPSSELQAIQTISNLKKVKNCNNPLLLKLIEEEEKDGYTK